MSTFTEARRAPLRGRDAVYASTPTEGATRAVAPRAVAAAGPSRPGPSGPVRRPSCAPGRPPRGAGLLTPLELHILELVSHGATRARIARDLQITQDTVATHLRRMFKKLDARDRASMVAAGFRLELLRPRPLVPGTVVPALPPRLAEVLPLVAAGLTNGAIGQRVGISPAGVNERLKSLYRLLGVGCREHAVRIAVEAGYLRLGPAGGVR